jgi:diguanylate cyclase (GGDEF)-like protein/PAS domain S-box-containing protein
MTTKGFALLLFFYKQLNFSLKNCFFILLILFTYNVNASSSTNQHNLTNSPIKFDHLTISDGLSQSYVFNIKQDSDGFIWIATEDGLNRYDGKNFVHYRHDGNDPTSIIDNQVRTIYIDNNETMWVATSNGLSVYNKESDSFKNFQHDDDVNGSLKDNIIWNIYQDNKNNMWVSTQTGLHKYNAIDNSFNLIKINGVTDKLKEIKTIFQDKNNNYWVGTYDNGVFILNENLSYAISLKDENKWNLIIDADGLYDIKFIENDYWLATNNGLFIISQNYRIIKHITTANSKVLSNKIRSIEKIDASTVWLATNKGLNSINLSDYSMMSYQKSSQKDTLSENWLMDIFKDKIGNVWIGTYGGGINKFNSISSQLLHIRRSIEGENFAIESITETSNGTVWFSTEQGDIYYLTPNSVIDKLQLDIEEKVTHLLSNEKGNLWIRTVSNKLFNFKNNKLQEHPVWFKKSKHPLANSLTFIKNNIWYINNAGQLSNYNIESFEFVNFSIADNLKLTSIAIENNQYIWVITETNKLFKFTIKNKAFEELNAHFPETLESKLYKNISVSKDWIWLGTYAQGLTLINRKNKHAKYFDESNDLKNNFIADILIDDQQNAWFATNKGIGFINPFTLKIKNFDNDFSINNTEFLNIPALKSSKNKMFFGSTNGVYQLSPSELMQIEQKISTPFFTDIFIANQKVKVKPQLSKKLKTDKFSLNKQVNFLQNLSLHYNQSPFSIEFVVPNAKLPSQVKYRYRLSGLEKEWIEASNNNRATYTNLSAGNYIFTVEAYDVYNTAIFKSKSINIRIMPPWWLSKSAILIYVLLTLLFFIYILRQVHHKRQYNIQIQKSEERLKLSLWGSGDEMWDWNVKTGKIFRSNIWGILEFPQDGTRNTGGDNTNLHQHDVKRVQQALKDHFEGKTEHFEATYRVKDKNNLWIWVLDRGKIVERDDKNTPTRMTGTLKDISQIKTAEERLKLFAKCIENISDAVVIYNKQFITVDINKAYQRITGKSKKDMIGKALTFNRYPDNFTFNVKKHLLTKGSWHGEIENRRADNSIYLTDLNIDIIRDESNNISHFVGVFSDITKRKETEEELRKLANSDTLTGLPNRSYFQANQIKLVKNKIPHALLVFDLDNFKKINDSLGHQVGDTLLCKVAQRLIKIGQGQDTVYRLGGDEFSIILENTNDIHTITSLAKKILQTIALPLKLRNQEIVLHGSIGIVLYPEDGASPQELLKKADTAMYHAKGLGGNKYQFFNESMNQLAVKRLQIESLIRQGLKNDLFSVYYQPKIEISTGKIAGMEALVRFKTPKNGLISPNLFIPVSEETGQILDIGEIVLRKACFATKKWVELGLFDGRIAVNLSAVQFTQPNLVSLIASILHESKLEAKYLELEITEGTVMDSPQSAIETMHKIRAMGIHLALDDFGTGYSSLAYLKKFPLNTLKIDKAFVDDIEHSEQGRNMVATIVTIAHNLDMHVVAEGVETTKQLSFLSELNCEQLQGYLYSKPLAESDFQKYLYAYQITDQSTNFSSKQFPSA